MYQAQEGSLTARIQSLLRKKSLTVPEIVEALELEVSLRTQGSVFQALYRLGAKKAPAKQVGPPRRGPKTSKWTLRGV